MFDHVPDRLTTAIAAAQTVRPRGRVLEAVGSIVRAASPPVRLGELCILQNQSDGGQIKAEVVGLSKGTVLLAPIGPLSGISSRTEVIPTGRPHMVGVGRKLVGRVLDGLGNPLDENVKGPLETEIEVPVLRDPPDPMSRAVIGRPLPTGVRAIDGLLTCGEGQRMGIFAAAGGGKSTLLAMLARSAQADIIVLALIGERGREVREFIERDLGEDGLKRAVVICATSDRSAIERAKAAYVATAVAEYFRDQGDRVLLLMDSVTRFGRALREIGLAAGEPPTRRGFPPSVFAELPKLMERTGLAARGSITALYTVLVEGDDMEEPIADEVRSILDGHIVLSRKLAAAGHYPAIDVLASASRIMTAVAETDHQGAALHLRRLLAKHAEVELLLRVGEYQAGSDAEVDEAVGKIARINAFLRQGTDSYSGMHETLETLRELVR